MMEDGISQSVGLIIEQQARAIKQYIRLNNFKQDYIEELQGLLDERDYDLVKVREELKKCKEHNEELVKQLSKCRCNHE